MPQPNEFWMREEFDGRGPEPSSSIRHDRMSPLVLKAIEDKGRELGYALDVVSCRVEYLEDRDEYLRFYQLVPRA